MTNCNFVINTHLFFSLAPNVMSFHNHPRNRLRDYDISHHTTTTFQDVIHRVWKKVTITFLQNYARCWPIIRVLSLADSAVKEKGKGFPYSTPSVGPGADPGVQAVSPQVTVSHPPGGRLPLLSARPAVTSPTTEHHHPLTGTKLYCLVTEAHRCEQLAQGCYAALPQIGFKPVTYWSQSPMLYSLHLRDTLTQQISNKAINKRPTTHQMHRYTTLWNIHMGKPVTL